MVMLRDECWLFGRRQMSCLLLLSLFWFLHAPAHTLQGDPCQGKKRKETNQQRHNTTTTEFTLPILQGTNALQL